ncbi:MULTISPECIES: hypothetical protein [Paenibacillus]|jgi:hypothetical protein|uniref:hypothetical protein n=1 Tax=Paenibacillus TaxID=44249 RepID=UPI00117E0E48|nr:MULTISPECIES: hypothetical protein [Paenibacillus]
MQIYYSGETNYYNIRFGVRIMTLMTTEKEKQFQIADYKNLIEKLIKRGSLFTLFKFQTEMIRELTADDPDFTQNRIVDFLIILKEVTDDCLTCTKCHQPYNFRICTGLSYEKDNAIELTCNGCGDCFTHSERRSHVTYFNFEAWREVDNLRKRSRGFTISYRLSYSPKKALLYIYDNKEIRPELWINGYQIFEAEEVKSYWDYSKGLIKQWKKDEELQSACIQIENAKIYTLDEVSKGD